MARLAAGFAAGVLLERNGYVPYVQRVGSPYWADWVQPNLDAIAKEISSSTEPFIRENVSPEALKSVSNFYGTIKDLLPDVTPPTAASAAGVTTAAAIKAPAVAKSATAVCVVQAKTPGAGELAGKKSRKGLLLLVAFGVGGAVYVNSVGLELAKKNLRKAYSEAKKNVSAAVAKLRLKAKDTPCDYFFQAVDVLAALVSQTAKDVSESPEYHAVCDAFKNVAEHPQMKAVVNTVTACGVRGIDVAKGVAEGPTVQKALKLLGQAKPASHATVEKLERNLSDLTEKVERLSAASQGFLPVRSRSRGELVLEEIAKGPR